MVALALLHITGPYAVIGPMIFVCCGSGLITPSAAAGSLGVDPRIAGAASGLGSFIQMAAPRWPPRRCRSGEAATR